MGYATFPRADQRRSERKHRTFRPPLVGSERRGRAKMVTEMVTGTAARWVAPWNARADAVA